MSVRKRFVQWLASVNVDRPRMAKLLITLDECYPEMARAEEPEDKLYEQLDIQREL